MGDYIKRLLIAGILGAVVGILFLGGKPSEASTVDLHVITKEWIWPTEGKITDTYGTRRGKHYGIDIAGETGTPIFAVADGVVTKSYYSTSYGNVVFVKHGEMLETVYAHLKERNVNVGQAVKKGDIIGKMGNTGRSSGSHLHFEVHEKEWTVTKENAINPAFVLGDIEVGKIVQADVSDKEKVIETVSKMNAQSSSENDEMIHIVQKGENLTEIAKKYQLSIQEIKKMNNLQSEVIYPSQKLTIKK